MDQRTDLVASTSCLLSPAWEPHSQISLGENLINLSPNLFCSQTSGVTPRSPGLQLLLAFRGAQLASAA